VRAAEDPLGNGPPILNPNVAAFRHQSVAQNAAPMSLGGGPAQDLDSVILGMDALNMSNDERHKLAEMAQVHAKLRAEKDAEDKLKKEQKEERKALESKIKKDNGIILGYMITYSDKLGKPDLQVKPLDDEETTYGIDWGERKKRKMDSSLAKEYLRDLMFERGAFPPVQQMECEVERMFREGRVEQIKQYIVREFYEKRTFQSLQQMESDMDRMFSEGELIKRNKTQPKPKLKILKKDEIDPYKKIPLNALMQQQR
jgi:hypothetical protein